MSAIEPNRSVTQPIVATVVPNEPERGRTQMTMYRFHARARRGATCVLALAVLCFGSAHAEHPQDDQVVGRGAEIGAVDFGADCGIEVLDRIDQALGLLHHMLYEQSRTVFTEVAEEEPSCAMAHWGVATTLFQPLWSGRPSPEALQRGWDASERARAVVGSVREDRLIEATRDFFRDPASADYGTRIERWAADVDGRADRAVDRVAVGDLVSALQQGDYAFAR